MEKQPTEENTENLNEIYPNEQKDKNLDEVVKDKRKKRAEDDGVFYEEEEINE